MLTALERESISIHQEKTRFEMEKEKLKNTLLRSISHDLRTPLTTIQTGSSFLYDSFNQLDDDMKKSLLRDINNETSRLSEFVENVLNLTRLNANQLKLHYKNELIEDIFDDIYQRVKNRLENHKLTFIKLDSDDFIHADIQLLIQVFINLIDNAIRHTSEESLINVSYQKIDKGLLFKVEDNGGGILPHQIEDIFKDYVTFDYHRGDHARGIGLGLSICKSIIEAHNGYIKADNNEIGGTTFSFYIPYEEGNQHE
jgi:two-component system sensor histidine kinase KdpD